MPVSSKTEHKKAIEQIMNPPPLPPRITKWKRKLWSKCNASVGIGHFPKFC